MVAVSALGGPVATADATNARTVAVEPGGRGHFAFERSEDTIFTRRQAPAGALDAPTVIQKITRPSDESCMAAYQPAVALDQNGGEVVMWNERLPDCEGALGGRRRAADGTLGPAQILAHAPYRAGYPRKSPFEHAQMAIAADGSAVIVWTGWLNNVRTVQGLRWAADGTVSPVVTLSQPGFPAGHPAVGVDPAGNAVVGFVGQQAGIVRVRRWSAAGVLGPIRDAGAVVTSDQPSEIRVDDDGYAVIGWGDRLRALRPDDTFGPVHDAAPDGKSTESRLAMTATGDALLVYTTGVLPSEDVRGVRMRRLSRSGTLGPIQTLAASSGPGREVHSPRIAVDPQGNAVTAWISGTDNDRILTRRRLSNGSLGTVATLTDPSRTGADNLEIAADEAGTATFVFSHYWPERTPLLTRRRYANGYMGPTRELYQLP